MSEQRPAYPKIRRGDVVWVSCDPSIGAEPKKTRTCVVVSNDIANEYGQVVTVIPTLKYTGERASRAYMVDLRKPKSDLKQHRVANASMIMSYDRRRILKQAGRLSAGTLKHLDKALMVHLSLVEI